MDFFWDLNLATGPPAWTGAVAVLIGLALGSFAGMLAYRLPRGLALDKPGSFCPACRTPVGFRRNIPLLSFALLKGRCADCRHRIHWRYPVSEALCALLALACWQVFGSSFLALVALLFCAALVTLAVIDLEHGLLPDTLTMSLLWGGLAFSLVPKSAVALHSPALALPGPGQAIAGAIAGYAALWIVNLVWRVARKRDGLGAGDLKLVAALGAWTGLNAIPLIVGISAIAGLAAGLTLILRGRARFSDEIPFGPFLAAGGILTFFLGPQAILAWLPGGFSA